MNTINQFIFPLRVYIDDTDLGGIVYHANHLKFFERARSEWLESLGLGYGWQQEQGVNFVVRAINIDYLRPARFPDQLEVVSEIKELRLASLICAQHLRFARANDTILSKAEVKIACIDHSFKACALPELMQQTLRGELA